MCFNFFIDQFVVQDRMQKNCVVKINQHSTLATLALSIEYLINVELLMFKIKIFLKIQNFPSPKFFF
jgi:hypothetical protein